MGATDAIKRSVDQIVIFYVDQIRPATTDADFEKSATEANIDIGLYKRIAAERALKAALSSVITAELLVEPVQQRDVSFVSIAAPQDGGMGEEVQVRHLLFSPNDDAQEAGRLEEGDPAWAAAKAEAQEAIDAIKLVRRSRRLPLAAMTKAPPLKAGCLRGRSKGRLSPHLTTPYGQMALSRETFSGQSRQSSDIT